ncbi:FCD domain-containing protein [Aurantimonas endophytica]|nr:GntR family transcriptional regulator [Aurantimonas endophytica]MCO6403972.1 FCD domain-containing protein [Aurantimonas endophytica]
MADRRRNAKERTVDRVYDSVREAILDGSHSGEARLTEEMLAERYGVSRTPVRAALQKLESDGFVDMIPRVGAVVKRRTLAEVAEIYEVRSLLESHAAGLAATRRREEDVDTLRRLQDEMDRVAGNGDVEGLSTLNRDFHTVILEASGNRTLAGSTTRLMEIGFLVHTYGNLGRQDVARSFTEHRNLIEAIGSRDVEWATTIMRGHLLGTRNALTQIMSEKRAGAAGT